MFDNVRDSQRCIIPNVRGALAVVVLFISQETGTVWRGPAKDAVAITRALQELDTGLGINLVEGREKKKYVGEGMDYVQSFSYLRHLQAPQGAVLVKSHQCTGVGKLWVAVNKVAAAKVHLAHQQLVVLHLLEAFCKGGANVKAAFADALSHFCLALREEGQKGSIDDLEGIKAAVLKAEGKKEASMRSMECGETRACCLTISSCCHLNAGLVFIMSRDWAI